MSDKEKKIASRGVRTEVFPNTIEASVRAKNFILIPQGWKPDFAHWGKTEIVFEDGGSFFKIRPYNGADNIGTIIPGLTTYVIGDFAETPIYERDHSYFKFEIFPSEAAKQLICFRYLLSRNRVLVEAVCGDDGKVEELHVSPKLPKKR